MPGGVISEVQLFGCQFQFSSFLYVQYAEQVFPQEASAEAPLLPALGASFASVPDDRQRIPGAGA